MQHNLPVEWNYTAGKMAKCSVDILNLSLEDPAETWNFALSQTILILEHSSSASSELYRAQSTACVEKLVKKLVSTFKRESINDILPTNLLVDCIRLYLRFREPITSNTAFQLTEVLGNLLISTAPDNRFSTAINRCFINLLFESSERIMMFWTHEVAGLKGVCCVLQSQLPPPDQEPTCHQLAAKLLHMTLAQWYVQ